MVPQQYPALHGFKFFLLIFLCLHHIAYGYLMINHHSSVFDIAGFDFYPLFVNGWVSIEFFYGVCGFYAAHYFLTKPETSYWRYVLAICIVFLPLYYIVLLASVMEWFPGFKVPFENTGFSHFYHIFMVSDLFLPNNNVMLGTMAVEFKFLLIVPLLVRLIQRYQNQKRALIVLIAVLVVMGILLRGLAFSRLQLASDHYHMNYFMFFMYCRMAFIYVMEPMLVGLVVAFICQFIADKKISTPSINMARVFFWAGLISLVIWSAGIDHFGHHTYYDALFQPLVTAGIFGMMLYGCVFGGAPCCFSGKIAAYFSHRVFGIYIIHIPLIQFSYNMAIKMMFVMGVPQIEFILVGLFFVVNVSLSWLFTEIGYYLLEKPAYKYAGNKLKQPI